MIDFGLPREILTETSFSLQGVPTATGGGSSAQDRVVCLTDYLCLQKGTGIVSCCGFLELSCTLSPNHSKHKRSSEVTFKYCIWKRATKRTVEEKRVLFIFTHLQKNYFPMDAISTIKSRQVDLYVFSVLLARKYSYYSIFQTVGRDFILGHLSSQVMERLESPEVFHIADHC